MEFFLSTIIGHMIITCRNKSSLDPKGLTVPPDMWQYKIRGKTVMKKCDSYQTYNSYAFISQCNIMQGREIVW